MTKKEKQFTDDLISLLDKYNVAMMQSRDSISFVSDSNEIDIDLYGYIDADSLRVIKESNLSIENEKDKN